jgi:hypothetical protein
MRQSSSTSTRMAAPSEITVPMSKRIRSRWVPALFSAITANTAQLLSWLARSALEALQEALVPRAEPEAPPLVPPLHASPAA